ncbi:peptidase M23-like protein [Novosphingobium kunmingense]|uniref:Peptidase M23-like protein n=1 Tax=Novosphingobium kunmingense TaxID=1211806 RepID=A0A2N0H335_9SPHN|nr:M23 family metallopeptidase [Novosphingobium kunmingense]PKB13329.1 peptidase M23-like protein [Novosphingobium kunmingense]
MAQFGWSTLIKTAAITAIVTSGLWLAAGLVWYSRLAPGAGAGDQGVPGEPAAANLSQGGPPVAPAGAAAQGASLVRASLETAPAPPNTPGALVMPVVGVLPHSLVDTFTQSRSDGRVHDAIDIMAARGTPVVAAASGTIEKLFWSNLGGNTAYVRSPDRRLIYYYAHLDAYAPGLAENRPIRAGAPIGTVGSTGNASPSGPHLHFAIMATSPDRKWYQPATAINPYPMLGRGAR